MFLTIYPDNEGFPSPDKVCTSFVEHDIDGSKEYTSVFQFILSDKRILANKEEVIETLASVGFFDESQAHAIGSLSGGWKMKLALARTILFKANILLLDEPTNHLDVVNIAWLENYLSNPSRPQDLHFQSVLLLLNSYIILLIFQISFLMTPTSSTTLS